VILFLNIVRLIKELTYREELNVIEDAFYEDRKNQMIQIRDEAQER
jgi:hypothetical protein